MPADTPELSVVIPTLNEQAAITGLLANLRAQLNIVMEIIIADGGSRDDTLKLCREFAAHSKPAVKLISTQPGRACQLNQGALLARGKDVLFVHADTEMCDPMLLCAALSFMNQQRNEKTNENIAGHFALRFKRSKNDAPGAYYFYESKTGLNRVDAINGDQGFLLSKAFFDSLGGFDESLPYMEDARLARKIFSQGLWVTLPGYVSTSARRFETEGLKQRQTLNALLCNFDHIGLHEFFTQAAAAYQTQDKNAPLALKPFLLLIHHLVKKQGLKNAFRLWYKTGAYVAGNAWQIPFAMDCAKNHRQGIMPGMGPAPRLKFFDKWLNPIVDTTLGRFVSMVLTFIWFYGLLLTS